MIKKRLEHQQDGVYAHHTGVSFHPEVLGQWYRDLQPKRYFTPSMSDPFHDGFTDEMIFTFFDTLRKCNWHYFIVPTKRAERLAELGPFIDWPEHLIMVVSVENARYLHRIELLRRSGAKRIGVSFEPLIGRIPLSTPEERAAIRGLDYVITGGETARRGQARWMRPEWVREIRDACLEEGVPYFHKQQGNIDEHGNYVGRQKMGRLLDGRTHDDRPRGFEETMAQLRVQAEAERLRRRQARRRPAA